jgi:hypothetical protein
VTTLIDRFMDKVSPCPNTGCWFWTASTKGKGYGAIGTRASRTSAAHRVSHELFKGPVGNLAVLHSCDQPCCVNPDHLRVGTILENNRERESKGRGKQPGGEDNAAAKLTFQQVGEIRVSSLSSRELGRAYGVSKTQILRIKRGISWPKS